MPPWEKQCGVTWLLSVLRRNLWGVKHCKTPDIPSSKRLHNYGKSPFWKNVLYNYFDWAIFNSKLLVYQRVNQPRGVKHQQPPQSGYHCKKHRKYGFVSKRGIYQFLRHPRISRNIITWNLNGNFKQDSHETKTDNSGDQKHHETPISLASMIGSGIFSDRAIFKAANIAWGSKRKNMDRWTPSHGPWWRIFWIPRFRKVTFNRWGRLPKLATAKSDQLACSMGLEGCRPQGCPKRSVLNHGKFVPISAADPTSLHFCRSRQTQPSSIFFVPHFVLLSVMLRIPLFDQGRAWTELHSVVQIKYHDHYKEAQYGNHVHLP